MAKYRLLRDRIAEELPETRLHVAPLRRRRENWRACICPIHRRHCPGHAGARRAAGNRLPRSEAMAERARPLGGGDAGGSRSALRHGLAGNLAGEHTTPMPAKAVALRVQRCGGGGALHAGGMAQAHQA